MAKENIQQIPSVKITKKQMEKSESCSVCWEDFSEGEEVKLLEDRKRRTEEHMAASVIRECANKSCGTRFVKETGCNLMTCPK